MKFHGHILHKIRDSLKITSVPKYSLHFVLGHLCQLYGLSGCFAAVLLAVTVVKAEPVLGLRHIRV